MVKKNTNAVEETAEKKVRRPRSTGKSAKPVDMPLYQRVLPPKKTKAAPAAEEQSVGEKPARGKKTDGTKQSRKTVSRKGKNRQVSQKPSMKVYFLGGLNEIGKNFTLFECGNDMVIVDCGLAFPTDDMLGIDLVLPDFTFVERNADKIRGIVLTHGHEDHPALSFEEN